MRGGAAQVAMLVCCVLAAAPWSLATRAGCSARRSARTWLPERGSWLQARGSWLRARQTGAAGPRGAGVERAVVVDPAVVVDLAAAALAAGAPIPGALAALAAALGPDGRVLARAGSLLLLGAPWGEAWEGCPAWLRELRDALEPAWLAGVPAAPLLTLAADRVRSRRARLAHEAAARLGVRLVLPLGLCFLPAFVLLGLAPVVLSAGGAFVGP